ncbi:hypothetical protein HYY69_07325 [Candidatus Woesearchaeota archaeon]|nr:hypothetical protein [Candidatus Woesearchaeota archaeon]
MRIGVDLDNVLADHMSALIAYYNRIYSNSLNRDGFKSLKFWETWGGTREQAIDLVHDFYASPEFEAMLPVDGAQEGINLLKSDHRLEIITARPSDLIPITSQWLNKYFPETFAGAYFANHYARNGWHSSSKRELCGLFDIDLLVEDSLEHAIECVDQIRPVVLLDNPWNQTPSLPTGIYRVGSWKEVVAVIRRY